MRETREENQKIIKNILAIGKLMSVKKLYHWWKNSQLNNEKTDKENQIKD